MVFIEHRARPATKKKFCFFLLQTLKTALSFSKNFRPEGASPPPPTVPFPKTLENKISRPPHPHKML